MQGPPVITLYNGFAPGFPSLGCWLHGGGRRQEEGGAALAKLGRALLRPLQVDVRIVVCEQVNVFPSLAFLNPTEMHSYIRFGIRPLLYGVLRREFLNPREFGICANTQCREFFEVERAGQRFRDEECSRRQRQRDYWQLCGKRVRQERLGAQTKRRAVKLPRPNPPGPVI